MLPLASARRTRHQRDYFLYDQFTTALAAGSVNGTLAEPVGGARTVTDTNGKITISGGLLSFATGAALSDRVDYTSLTRKVGQALISTNNLTASTENFRFGWNLFGENFQFSTTNLQVAFGGGSAITVGTRSATPYQTAIIQRSSGVWYFIKGGLFTNWSLVYVYTGTTSGAIPSFGVRSAASVGTFDNIRVPKQLYIPIPLQSDGMSAATTDGLGNPENNGTAGNAYTNVGTWGVTGGKRACSVLSGGLGFSYLPTSSSNVIIEAVCTRSAGVTGLVARYEDAGNYLIAYHDGTNAKLDKVVAGTTTNLLSAAVAYAAAAVMILHLDGTSARLFYNNAAVGTVATTPAAGSLNHGVYTTDTGATFDNLVVLAKGNEGQHEDLGLL